MKGDIYMVKKMLIGFSMVLFLLSSVTYWNFNKQETSISSATWNDHYDDINELSYSSDIIIKGTLESSSTQLRNDVVFTMNSVKITDVISGDIKKGDIIEILQTGGTYKNIYTPPIESVPLLENGESYLLYLNLTEYHPTYGQYYLISGGYQGLALVNDKGFVEPVTSSNSIFSVNAS